MLQVLYLSIVNCWTSDCISHLDFEDIDSDPMHVKCLVCSAVSDTQDIIILRTGRSEHSTRKKHLAALANRTAGNGTSAMQQAVPSRDPPPAEQAHFTLSDILLDSDSEDEGHRPQRNHSPLDDIMMDGNQFFDANRTEMFFSAGTEETGAARRQELLEGMKNLDYYDHTVFGKIDREDPTISEAVAAMEEMGRLQQYLCVVIDPSLFDRS
jgi:hypothetical protein